MLLSLDLVWTDVLEEYIASILRVEKTASQEPWSWYIRPKCRFTEDPHDATSQTTEFFMEYANFKSKF
jgi:hypothetical protein